MPLIEHPLPWDRQPGPEATADPRWLSRGLALVMHAGAVRDPILGHLLAPPIRKRTAMGDAWSSAGNGGAASHNAHRLPVSTDRFTMLAWGVTENKIGSSNEYLALGIGGPYFYNGIGFRSYGGSPPRARAYYYPDYSGSAYCDAASVLEYGPHVIAARYIRNDRLDAIVDGAVVSTVAAGNYAAGLAAIGTPSIRIASSYDGMNLTVSGVALFLDALSDAEIAEISRNPWQLYAPEAVLLAAVAASGYTHPTLSSARMGSLSPSGGYPTVTYTF